MCGTGAERCGDKYIPVQVSKSRILLWRAVRAGVCLLLLTAAALKSLNSREIIASDGLLDSLALLLSVVGFEAALAVYIVLASEWWSWVAVSVSFTLFWLVAAYSLLTGSDCQCFGDQVGARVTLPLDLSILAISVYCRRAVSVDSRPVVGCAVITSVLVGLAFAGFALQVHKSRHLAVENGGYDVEFLLSSLWIGKQWPLDVRHHPLMNEMHKGKWLVIVLRSDCEHCRDLVEREFSATGRWRGHERTAVFLAGDRIWPFQFDNVTTDLNGESTILWTMEEPFVASPAIFVLQDGLIASAADGVDADEFIAELP